MSRDLVLYDIMYWAGHLHGVGLALATRGENVVIADFMATAHQRGHASRVMAELCSWADCSRVTLELTPSTYGGSGAGHLAVLCASLKFRCRHEQPTLFDLPDSLIRQPIRGRAHVRF